MKLLANSKKIAFRASPLISALVFYVLVIFRLKAGDYLSKIGVLFLVFAIPLSYVRVLIFGLPSLIILKRFNLVNYFSLAVTGFINGVLTVLALTMIVLIVQKTNIKKVYGDMLEPILAANIAGLVGILIF